MGKKALISWGGWPGHDPERWAAIAQTWLKEDAYEVESTSDLDVFLDKKKLSSLSLIVPIWTMGHMSDEQETGLVQAVESGAGLAGWHGMCAAFNDNLRYKWMTGGQMVAHPGDCIPSYSVKISDSDHEITAGLSDFMMTETEQYYLHVDPSNRVLATTVFQNGCVMPVVWTRRWGAGRVFYTSLGHAPRDFEIPAAMSIVRRGLRWAAA